MNFQLTDSNYIEELNKHFADGDTVIVSIGKPKCPSCNLSSGNVADFFSKFPASGLVYCQVDSTTDHALQNDKNLYYFLQYPKNIIYYGNWDNRDYIEGPLDDGQIYDIYKKSLIKSRKS